MPTLTANAQVNVKYQGKTVTAEFVSWSDRYPGYANVTYQGKKLIRAVAETTADTVPDAETEADAASPYFSISERFSFITQLVESVISGYNTGLVVTGSGGLGKTYTVMQTLADNDLGEGDCVIVKGHATALSLYKTLFDNREKIIVFDDCDAVLDDKTAVNLLKAALDTSDRRMVSWISSRENLNSLPPVFEFKGRVIFISNKRPDAIPQPLLSRCLSVDVTMTTDEKIQRIEALLPKIMPDMDVAAKAEVLVLIKKHRNVIADLNVRTFIKTCSVYQCRRDASWQRLAIYLLTNTHND